MNDYKAMLNQLKNGEVTSLLIKKEEFLQFREHLLKDDKFKYIRGEAKQGGDVVYTMLKEPRA